MKAKRAFTFEDAADDTSEWVRAVDPLRVSASGAPPARDHCEVVVETLLTIMVEGAGSFAVMCTPCDAVALAIGFVFSEGMISGVDDVIKLSRRGDPPIIAMQLDSLEQVPSGRSLIVTSSCGLCGSRNIDKLMAGLTLAKSTLRVPNFVLCQVGRDARSRQALFTRTGATHAAAIFSADGEIIATGEDIGRHNALDKSIGKCLLNEQSLQQRGVMLSGRVSLELVAKCARAGIELIAAVSAPSSLAIQAAERCNITLCGFVRDDRATIYTHPRRIQGLESLTP
ncbi:MAG: formate dehydrogenase accessory sulfurtransferase FdhD [Phycisphaerae bacterium]|nr:formate dehydrogenase accessory sulfurtransferase FdhD [Phycisphaerae bacterium]